MINPWAKLDPVGQRITADGSPTSSFDAAYLTQLLRRTPMGCAVWIYVNPTSAEWTVFRLKGGLRDHPEMAAIAPDCIGGQDWLFLTDRKTFDSVCRRADMVITPGPDASFFWKPSSNLILPMRAPRDVAA